MELPPSEIPRNFRAGSSCRIDGVVVAAAVSSVATLVLAGLVAFYACRRPAGRDLEGPVEIKTPPHEETKHSA